MFIYCWSRRLLLLLLLATASARAGESMAAGNQHVVYLAASGTVWTWGANGSGQLGLGHQSARSWPVQVGSLSGVISVAAGNDVTLAVKSDGTVWAWGYEIGRASCRERV